MEQFSQSVGGKSWEITRGWEYSKWPRVCL